MKKKNAGYVEIPEEELRKLYYEDLLSIQQIAKHYYVTHPTIHNRMKEFNFEKRPEHSSWKRRAVIHLRSKVNEPSE